MDKEINKENSKCFGCYVIFSVTLTIIGFIVIPKLIKKYGNKLYKASLKRQYIDFDNLGPEIVKKQDMKK